MPCRNRVAAPDAELNRFIGRAQKTSMEPTHARVASIVDDVGWITTLSLNISAALVTLLAFWRLIAR